MLKKNIEKAAYLRRDEIQSAFESRRDADFAGLRGELDATRGLRRQVVVFVDRHVRSVAPFLQFKIDFFSESKFFKQAFKNVKFLKNLKKNT